MSPSEDKVPNTDVLERANMNSMPAIICERRLHWLGHVRRMDKGRIPKDLLYGELVEGTRLAGRPHLCFKDVCKRDMKTCHIVTNTCAKDCATWRLLVKQGTKRSEKERKVAATEKRAKRKERQQQIQQATVYLQSLHQRLPFRKWNVQPLTQPHKKKEKKSGHYAIVFSRRKDANQSINVNMKNANDVTKISANQNRKG